MSRIRLNLTLDTLRMIRILLDESTGLHSAYSISRRLDLGYSGVRFALNSLHYWDWVVRTPHRDEAINSYRVYYRLTPAGHEKAVTALESIGALVSPRIFIGVPPPPVRPAGIFAAST